MFSRRIIDIFMLWPLVMSKNTPDNSISRFAMEAAEGSEQQCLICSDMIDQIEAEYCNAHREAIAHLRDAYKVWEVGYAEITRHDFLSRIIRLHETGDGAREAADFLLQNPARWK